MVLVFLVAGLFIGTTIAGARVIETYIDTEEPCPAGQTAPAGVYGLQYDGYYFTPGPRYKHVEINEIVNYRFSVVWSDSENSLHGPVTVKLMSSGTELGKLILNDRSKEFFKFEVKFEKDGEYPIMLRWNDSDGELRYGGGIWKELITYVGDVKSKSKDDPKEEPCPAAGNGNPGIESFFFQDIRTPIIYRCTNTELVDGKVEIRFHVDLSFSGEGGPATDIDLEILENDIEVVSLHIDRNDEDMSEVYIFTRNFTYNGTYTLKARADAYNSEGTHWGTFAFPLKVNVGKEYWQKSKSKDDQLGFRLLFLKFLDRFPILERILSL